jgi:hypothetical protein
MSKSLAKQLDIHIILAKQEKLLPIVGQINLAKIATWHIMTPSAQK